MGEVRPHPGRRPGTSSASADVRTCVRGGRARHQHCQTSYCACLRLKAEATAAVRAASSAHAQCLWDRAGLSSCWFPLAVLLSHGCRGQAGGKTSAWDDRNDVCKCGNDRGRRQPRHPKQAGWRSAQLPTITGERAAASGPVKVPASVGGTADVCSDPRGQRSERQRSRLDPIREITL